MDPDARDRHDDTAWLLPPQHDPEAPPAGEPTEILSSGPKEPSRRRTVGMTIGLLALGAAVGAVAVSQLGSRTSPQATAASLPGNSVPGNGFGDRFGRGGLDGEQRLHGTLTAVGGSTVTVRTSNGTATYTVTGATDVVRNGARVTLSQLRVGDPVFVHVYPSDSGGSMLVERIFAGTLPGGGFFGDGRGGGDGAPGQSTRT